MAEDVKGKLNVVKNPELKPAQGLGGEARGAHPYTTANSPMLGAGIFEFDNVNFEFPMSYDEVLYVLEGKVACTDDQGGDVEASAGDVMYIPSGRKIRFRSVGKAKVFNVTSKAQTK